MIEYESIQVYAALSRVSFWGIPFSQYHILVHPCQQIPLKKGNSQMDSSVQDNPAAPPPCQYTLKALLNSVLGKQSSTQFAQHFLNRLVSSRPMSTSTAMSDCFQPGQAKVMPGPTPLRQTFTCSTERSKSKRQGRGEAFIVQLIS